MDKDLFKLIKSKLIDTSDETAYTIYEIEWYKHHNFSLRPAGKENIERLNKYVLFGVDPGGFLRAALSNDLEQTLGRADEDNIPRIYAIASYIHTYIPSMCHGSRELIRDWINRFKDSQEDWVW